MKNKSASAYCHICLTYYDYRQFRFLTCGHGCCDKCMSSIPTRARTSRKRCPICREERGEDFKLYLELVDSTKATVEGLSKMDDKAKLISVAKAEGKIRHAADDLECDNDLAKQLLDAVSDFKERIVPLFRELEALSSVKVDLETSRRRNDELEKAARFYDGQMRLLRRDVRNANEVRDDALRTAKDAAEKTVSLNTRNGALEAEMEEMREENGRLRGQRDNLKKKELSQRDKIHAQSEEIARLKKELEMERNLMIEHQSSSMYSDPRFSDSIDLDDEDTPSSPSSSRLPMGRIDNASTGPAAFHFEGMPQSGFTGWTLQGKKRKAGSDIVKVKNPTFPISLDKKGHPTVPIQLGPKRRRRVASQF